VDLERLNTHEKALYKAKIAAPWPLTRRQERRSGFRSEL